MTPRFLPFRRIVAAPLAVALLLGAVAGKPQAPGGRGQQTQGTPQGPGGQNQLRAQRVFLAPTIVQRVRRQDIEASVSTTGSAVPVTSRLLRAEEAGRLAFTKKWVEGDPVKQGEIIATIASETLENQIKQAAADVELQKESLGIARRSMNSAIEEHRTLQDLYARGIAARKDVDRAELEMHRAKNSFRQGEISLEKAIANLKTQAERVDRLTLRAPFDGLIVARSTLEGTGGFTKSFGRETITDYDGRLIGNEFAICGVVAHGQMLMRCDVTSKDIDRVKVGQDARLIVYATEDFELEGTVKSIAGAVSPDTRAFSVDIEVKEVDPRLKPGMFGRVEVVVERRRQTISVAKDIVTRRNNRDVVYVAEKSPEADYWVAVERAVELGLEGRETVEILNGLQEGDAVVVRGFEVLQDRTPISVRDIDAPTTGTATADTQVEVPETKTGA